MKRVAVLMMVCFIAGCGYTTRGFIYDGKTITVEPIINKIDITAESRQYSGYTSFPILIENSLLNEIISQFNIDGGLKVVSDDPQALSLTCVVERYDKQALRYSDDDAVKEQRLRLHVRMTLKSPQAEVLKARTVVGEASFFLSGPNQRSEEAAQRDLIDDTARRIVEAVVEEW